MRIQKNTDKFSFHIIEMESIVHMALNEGNSLLLAQSQLFFGRLHVWHFDFFLSRPEKRPKISRMQTTAVVISQHRLCFRFTLLDRGRRETTFAVIYMIVSCSSSTSSCPKAVIKRYEMGSLSSLRRPPARSGGRSANKLIGGESFSPARSEGGREGGPLKKP